MSNDITPGGRHRRADGEDAIFGQVVIGQGYIWRWSIAKHVWQVIA